MWVVDRCMGRWMMNRWMDGLMDGGCMDVWVGDRQMVNRYMNSCFMARWTNKWLNET